MSNKKLKRIFSLIVLCVIIIIILILGIIFSLEQQYVETENNVSEELSEETITTTETSFDKYEYLQVTNCISVYLSGINQENAKYYSQDESGEYVITATQEEINENAYNFLSIEYIENNNINIDNVYDFVPEVKQNLFFVPLDIKKQAKINTNQYIVYGYMTDTQYNMQDSICSIVNIDKINNTFSIIPIDYQEYENMNFTDTDLQIEANSNNNVISTSDNSDEYIMKQYFQIYKRMMLSNAEIAYEYLEESYRDICYGNLENFQEYINNNYEEIFQMTLDSYTINTYDDYNEYIEKDKNENYYIFNISNTNPADFNVMLDTYIVGTRELQQEYENGSNSKKVTLNVQRFVYAINNKNYYYAYNLLAESFRNNNFSTQEQFEEYVENNFFENNNISEQGTFGEEGGYYTYELTISDEQGNTKTLMVIMQLQEGTDFVMSFSIE